MPKNLLVWRKTSLLLKPRSSTVSLGSRRVCSKADATWHPMPPLKSLFDASSIRGLPPSMGAGSHAWGSRNWLSTLSAPRLGAWLVFCCFVALWASSSLDGRGLPVSITSLPFCFLIFLGLTYSVLEGKVGWGARGGDLGGGGGSLGWKDFPASPLPSWLFNSSYRLLWSFLWIPISFGTFLGGEGWLKTSNSSVDSVRSIKPSPSCSFSSSSSTWRMGEGDGTLPERVATGSGWVSSVFLGRGMPSGTTNPS